MERCWLVRGGREGVALPVVLLFLMALSAFGHGTLLLSMRELRATWAFRNLVRADQAGKLGLHLAFQVQEVSQEDRTPWVMNALVSGATEDGLVYQAGRRWLADEFFLLESRGGVQGWPGERRLVWLGWSLLPTARMRAFLAAVEVGSGIVQESGARLEADDFLETPEGWDISDCEIYLSALDSLFQAPLPPLAVKAPQSGPYAEENRPPPGLGLLTGRELIRRSKATRGASQRPETLKYVKGRGSQTGDEPPTFLGANGDLELDGGRVSGLLVTGGNLRLRGDAIFQGLALVGGDLVLEDQARIQGLARVSGGLALRDESAFQASACPVLRVLGEIPALMKPLALSTEMPLG